MRRGGVIEVELKKSHSSLKPNENNDDEGAGKISQFAREFMNL
jgi:hypothetical protein